MKNEYLEKIKALGILDDQTRPWYVYTNDCLLRAEDQEEWKKGFQRRMKRTMTRDSFVKHYAWAIPFKPALEVIRQYAPLIEIGAGKGYWAALLNCDIICFDLLRENKQIDDKEPWFEVQKGSHEKIKEHTSRTLFLCWPPYTDSMAVDCLKNYLGEHLVFIGEGGGGCTADDNFWEIIEEEWTEIECVRLPQWDGVHNCLTIYKRKDTTSDH